MVFITLLIQLSLSLELLCNLANQAIQSLTHLDNKTILLIANNRSYHIPYTSDYIDNKRGYFALFNRQNSIKIRSFANLTDDNLLKNKFRLSDSKRNLIRMDLFYNKVLVTLYLKYSKKEYYYYGTQIPDKQWNTTQIDFFMRLKSYSIISDGHNQVWMLNNVNHTINWQIVNADTISLHLDNKSSSVNQLQSFFTNGPSVWLSKTNQKSSKQLINHLPVWGFIFQDKIHIWNYHNQQVLLFDANTLNQMDYKVDLMQKSMSDYFKCSENDWGWSFDLLAPFSMWHLLLITIPIILLSIIILACYVMNRSKTTHRKFSIKRKKRLYQIASGFRSKDETSMSESETKNQSTKSQRIKMFTKVLGLRQINKSTTSESFNSLVLKSDIPSIKKKNKVHMESLRKIILSAVDDIQSNKDSDNNDNERRNDNKLIPFVDSYDGELDQFVSMPNIGTQSQFANSDKAIQKEQIKKLNKSKVGPRTSTAISTPNCSMNLSKITNKTIRSNLNSKQTSKAIMAPSDVTTFDQKKKSSPKPKRHNKVSPINKPTTSKVLSAPHSSILQQNKL
ncbi:hypothetical protein BLOT_004773 [Blomia tropicalis]|nr:hypothetical protein BLOT_004773 [Blomia tropicalis]